MAGRRVFFSFHYKLDVWRAAIVRNAGVVDAVAAAGWDDASLWEKAKAKGDDAVARRIKRALKHTTATVVLIGEKTATRRWVKKEIEWSVGRGNGLLGIRIHELEGQDGAPGVAGPIPAGLEDRGYSVYDWDPHGFGRWVEWAAIDAGKPCLEHGKQLCLTCRRPRS